MRGSAPARLVLVSTALVVAGLIGAVGAGASAEPRGERLSPEQRGLVLDGLARDDACGAGYRVTGVDGVVCTPGPDAAPADRDVQEPRELATESGTAGTSSGQIPCYGDGTSGKRVQAVYARAADVPDRSADVVPLIRQWAAGVNDVVVRSAAKTGGLRNVRWVTSGCQLDVVSVTLTSAGDDDFSATQYQLSRAGLNRTDRKYLVWVDAPRYCGVATFVEDDSAGASNGNNAGPSYARIDRGCWGTPSAEVHELFHMLGSVQTSAPNTSGGGHCVDEYDALCYADSSSVQLRYPCAYADENLLDCGNDDYFHTAPPAGSYLATHWNSASSEFLTALPPGSPDPSTTPSGSTGGTTKGGKGGSGGGGGGKKG